MIVTRIILKVIFLTYYQMKNMFFRAQERTGLLRQKKLFNRKKDFLPK